MSTLTAPLKSPTPKSSSTRTKDTSSLRTPSPPSIFKPCAMPASRRWTSWMPKWTGRAWTNWASTTRAAATSCRFLSQENKAVRRFIFSDPMAEICRATIGPEAFLFLDQYVVKAAEKGMSFSLASGRGLYPVPQSALCRLLVRPGRRHRGEWDHLRPALLRGRHEDQNQACQGRGDQRHGGLLRRRAGHSGHRCRRAASPCFPAPRSTAAASTGRTRCAALI